MVVVTLKLQLVNDDEDSVLEATSTRFQKPRSPYGRVAARVSYRRVNVGLQGALVSQPKTGVSTLLIMPPSPSLTHMHFISPANPRL